MAIPKVFLTERATIIEPVFTQDENCMSVCTDEIKYENIAVCLYNIKNNPVRQINVKDENETKMRVGVPPQYNICTGWKIKLWDCHDKYLGVFKIDVARPVCGRCKVIKSHWELDVEYEACDV